MRLTNFSLQLKEMMIKRTLQDFKHLLALLSRYLQWKALACNKVYIVVKDTAQVEKVVSVDRRDRIYDFLLKFCELVSID